MELQTVKNIIIKTADRVEFENEKFQRYTKRPKYNSIDRVTFDKFLEEEGITDIFNTVIWLQTNGYIQNNSSSYGGYVNLKKKAYDLIKR